MSDFKTALKITLSHEGGYSNVAGDTGGETYQGISRKNWPAWRGWPIVDKAKPLKQNQLLKDQRLADLVEVFYYDHFWKPIQGERIADQRVANFLLDFYINSGYHAVKTAQRLIGAKEDGVMGPNTLAAINAAEPAELLSRLKAARLSFLKGIVARNPSQEKFLNGWQNRVDAF